MSDLIVPTNGNGRWRISKEISIAVLGFIIMQTATFGWFLAQQSLLLTSVVSAVSKAESTQYTKDDARREREYMDQRFLNESARIDQLERRISVIEGQVRAK